jgi:hypothetical protein
MAMAASTILILPTAIRGLDPDEFADTLVRLAPAHGWLGVLKG